MKMSGKLLKNSIKWTLNLQVQGVEGSSGSFVFLFLPRMDAFCNLTPPARHFLKAAIDSLADSNTYENITTLSVYCRKIVSFGSLLTIARRQVLTQDAFLPRISSLVRRGTNFGTVIVEEL
jgi:hypothetical protein